MSDIIKTCPICYKLFKNDGSNSLFFVQLYTQEFYTFIANINCYEENTPFDNYTEKPLRKLFSFNLWEAGVLVKSNTNHAKENLEQCTQVWKHNKLRKCNKTY